MNLKRILDYFLSALCLLLLFCLPSLPEAAVSGSCGNCHTMHDSQTGKAVVYKWDYTTFITEQPPIEVLLKTDCVGCHTSTGTDTITALGGNNVPIVFNPNGYTTNALAGGNFKDLTEDTKGHNVVGIYSVDTNYSAGNIPGSSTSYYQVRCAGANGCHGNRSIADQTKAMEGAHHGSSAVGNSYRFLNNVTGVEDTNWEYTLSSTDHNEYKGAYSFGDITTISYLCGQCHGDFHSPLGVGGEDPPASPWIRHPTDVNLKGGTGEYANYTAYSTLAPVARPDPSAITDHNVVNPANDIVMCLSCHRAHASPYFKIIRWDYKGEETGATLSDSLKGCNVCHTSKN